MILDRIPSLIDPHWVDFVVQHLDPTFSLTRTLAQLVGIRDEAHDTKTFLLRSRGRPWAFRPGQSVGLRVNLAGIVHERRFSPTSDPGDPVLALTVKRNPAGVVSAWLHDSARTGDVLEVGPAAGEFVLPSPVPPRLLLVAGGSGITAVYALLRDALGREPNLDAILLYYAHGPNDFPFAVELRRLAERYPGVRIEFCGTQTGSEATPRTGRFAPDHLEAWAPDFTERDTFVCGPPGLTATIAQHWCGRGLGARLHSEAFGAPAEVNPDSAPSPSQPIHLRRSARTVAGVGRTLLAIAEENGLRPPTGCRMGICHTCTCTKVSGVVRDRVTGVVDRAPDSRVRLCVSEPLGPVVLDL